MASSFAPAGPHDRGPFRLGHYEIVRELGAGAMGVVLLARDLRLERRVALKSLPEAFADDEERLARFEREARMLAALHHPHVASLFGLEELEGRRYLVMEYVEGETLAERIARGAVDLGEALKLAEQIARGLAAAHDQGIIHRDLKPGNILVTPGGGAKVVDFGLAKDVKKSAVVAAGFFSSSGIEATVAESSSRDDITRISSPSGSVEDESDDDLALAPTVVAGSSSAPPSADPLATEPGAVLGTAAYMSPEQARGQAVDRRCDVWAFGCVVFEMLTRRRPFQGDSLMQTLTAVLQSEPPWEALPPYTPPALERLLRRCLRKDPDERLRDLGDAALELRDIRSGKLREIGRSAKSTWPVVVGAALAGLIVGLAGWSLVREAPAPPPSVRFTLPSPDLQSGLIIQSNLAVAPDGRSWVYRSDAEEPPRLMMRRLGATDAIPIPGTDNAENPFFSPDGRHLGFTRGPQLLRTEPFQGSPRVILTLEEGSFVGQPSWGDDAKIFYATLPQRGVYLVGDEGGSPTKVLSEAELPGASLLAWPEHVGPDHFAVFVSIDNRLETRLVSRDGSHSRPIEGVESRVIFLEPDLLVFVRDREILVQRLDVEAAALVGEPVRLASGVAWNSRTGNGSFAISSSLLVLAQREYRARMQWFDAASGNALDSLGEPGDLSMPRVSPEGDRVVVALAEISGGAEDLWVYDLERKVGARLTHTPAAESMAAWSPDGQRLAYYSDEKGPPDVMIRSADSDDPGRVLVDWSDPTFPFDWLPDGSAVLFQTFPESDIYFAPVDGSPPELWLRAAGFQGRPRSSPDGTWLVFGSTELGTGEIFAAPLADPGRRIRISTAGGDTAAWAPDGRSIYFHDDRRIYRADIDTANRRVATPETIVELSRPDRIVDLDVTPDGTRLLVAIVDEDLLEPSTLVHVGWRELLGGG